MKNVEGFFTLPSNDALTQWFSKWAVKPPRGRYTVRGRLGDAGVTEEAIDFMLGKQLGNRILTIGVFLNFDKQSGTQFHH